MENKNDIGKAFRDKLDGLQKQPRPAVWDAISADLDKNKKAGPAWWGAGAKLRTILIVILLLLLGFVGYFLYPENTPGINGKDTEQRSESGNSSGINGKEAAGVNDNATVNNADDKGLTTNENVNSSNNPGNTNNQDAANKGAGLGSGNPSGKTGSQNNAGKEGSNGIADGKNNSSASKNSLDDTTAKGAISKSNPAGTSTANNNSKSNIATANRNAVGNNSTAYGSNAATKTNSNGANATNHKTTGVNNSTGKGTTGFVNAAKNSGGNAATSGSTSTINKKGNGMAGSPANKNNSTGKTGSSNNTSKNSNTGLVDAAKNSSGNIANTTSNIKGKGNTKGSPIDKNSANSTAKNGGATVTNTTKNSNTGFANGTKNSEANTTQTGTSNTKVKTGHATGSSINQNRPNSNAITSTGATGGIAQMGQASGKNKKDWNAASSSSNENPANSDAPKTDAVGKNISKESKDTDKLKTPEESTLCLADSLCIVKDTLGKSLLAAKEDNKDKDSNATGSYKRFFVFAHVAPTQYTLPKNTMAMDTLLRGNKTTVKASYSYGAYIGYNINSKWSVRAGVIKSGLEQITQNASLQSKYVVVPGNATDPDGYVHVLPPSNYSGINYTGNASNAAITQVLGASTDTTTVNLKQRLEFLEIPISVQYNVFGSKFGLGITGSFGLLHVTKNNVYAENTAGRLLLGSYRNIKTTGYTGSLGLQLYYRPLPALQINVEPTFKYYFNTFSNATPYSVGLQVGLQYNFDLFGVKK